MTRTGEPLGPWWLERQLDPDSADFTPGSARVNVTHRDWLQLGTVGTAARAIVDPRGLVTPTDASWSLDWWIGADDRWHVPAREVAVRQQRLETAPIVETAMRVPGGDAIHRVFAVQGASGPLLVVEIENRTSIPFAVALAIVPYNAGSGGRVRTIVVDGDTVVVDGRIAMLLPKPPARMTADCIGGALASVVGGDATAPSSHEVVSCDDGTANAALIFPLPHTVVLRVVLPMRRDAAPDRDREMSTRVPSWDEVARGWRTQVDRGPHIDLPDDRFQHAFDAARRDLLLLPAGEDVTTWPGAALPWTTRSRVLEALDHLGFHSETEAVLAAFPDEQRLDGAIVSSDDAMAANGAALRSLALHWQITRDGGLIEQLIGPVAKAGHWIEKRRGARRRSLLGEGRYLDAFWSISGLSAIAPVLATIGQPEVAEDLQTFAVRLTTDLDAALGSALDLHAIGNLAAAALGVWAADDDRVRELVDITHERWLVDGMVIDPDGWGLSPHLTLELAMVNLLTDDPRAAARVIALIDSASPVGTWPEVIHPRSGGGSRGCGHDPLTTAAFCSFVRAMLVREDRGGLALCSVVPDSWLGQSWEVRDMPTAFGRLGFAVRWHGERPAILWELEPHDGINAVELAVPGLDATWSSSDLRGEALLAPVGRSDDDETKTPTQPPVQSGGTEASSSFA